MKKVRLLSSIEYPSLGRIIVFIPSRLFGVRVDDVNCRVASAAEALWFGRRQVSLSLGFDPSP